MSVERAEKPTGLRASCLGGSAIATQLHLAVLFLELNPDKTSAWAIKKAFSHPHSLPHLIFFIIIIQLQLLNKTLRPENSFGT